MVIIMNKLLQYNGYIVQRKNKSEYKGIEGDNWYLNYCSNNDFFEEFYNQIIDKAWNNTDYIDCCTNEFYIKKYINESIKMGIDFRILLWYSYWFRRGHIFYLYYGCWRK